MDRSCKLPQHHDTINFDAAKAAEGAAQAANGIDDRTALLCRLQTVKVKQ